MVNSEQIPTVGMALRPRKRRERFGVDRLEVVTVYEVDHDHDPPVAYLEYDYGVRTSRTRIGWEFSALFEEFAVL